MPLPSPLLARGVRARPPVKAAVALVCSLGVLLVALGRRVGAGRAPEQATLVLPRGAATAVAVRLAETGGQRGRVTEGRGGEG